MTDVVTEFIARYRREFDYYQEAARLVAQQCDSQLETVGIRAIVTYRAKRPESLLRKLRTRAVTTPYATVDAIYADIHDLAGVRVALYFPGDREKVERLLLGKFVLTEPPKVFPNQAIKPAYEKRFSGYWATHYRLRLIESELLETQKRYSDAKVEVQVASVLMHGWAEVEHDLVYKPATGKLSTEEYAILDELNGLVLAGEIALERLQRAFERRVEKRGVFGNHYELAAFLYDAAKAIVAAAAEPIIGRVDILFQLLVSSGLNSPAAIEPYLKSLERETEHRPVADQIIDQIIAADPAKYDLYARVRRELTAEPLFDVPTAYSADWDQAVGAFMTRWIALERALRAAAESVGMDPRRAISPRTIVELPFLDDRDKRTLEALRRIRNNLVHGMEMPHPIYLQDAARQVGEILERLSNSEDAIVAASVRQTLMMP